MSAPDWDAVAAAVRARMVERELTQAQVAARAGVALMTVRELQQGVPRRRSPRTLAAVSAALDWSGHHLAAVANGYRAPADPLDELRAEVEGLRRQVDELRALVEDLRAR